MKPVPKVLEELFATALRQENALHNKHCYDLSLCVRSAQTEIDRHLELSVKFQTNFQEVRKQITSTTNVLAQKIHDMAPSYEPESFVFKNNHYAEFLISAMSLYGCPTACSDKFCLSFWYPDLVDNVLFIAISIPGYLHFLSCADFPVDTKAVSVFFGELSEQLNKSSPKPQTKLDALFPFQWPKEVTTTRRSKSSFISSTSKTPVSIVTVPALQVYQLSLFVHERRTLFGSKPVLEGLASLTNIGKPSAYSRTLSLLGVDSKDRVWHNGVAVWDCNIPMELHGQIAFAAFMDHILGWSWYSGLTQDSYVPSLHFPRVGEIQEEQKVVRSMRMELSYYFKLHPSILEILWLSSQCNFNKTLQLKVKPFEKKRYVDCFLAFFEDKKDSWVGEQPPRACDLEDETQFEKVFLRPISLTLQTALAKKLSQTLLTPSTRSTNVAKQMVTRSKRKRDS